MEYNTDFNIKYFIFRKIPQKKSKPFNYPPINLQYISDKKIQFKSTKKNSLIA